MNERSLHILQAYLQREDVQERIRQNIQRGRSEATVTIGRAARLFNFTENKLRDWEALGLLTPLKPTGQRQYTPEELDKLAIIKELIDEGGYTPGMIPHDIDQIWASISSEQQDQAMKDGAGEVEHLHIDQRVDSFDKELFWRYYVGRVLRLSLLYICEDIPDTIAALVMPLQEKSTSVSHPDDLPKVGESLIGWLGRNRSFYVFLDNAPSFEFPSDFRIHPLQVMKEDMAQEDAPKDKTLIVIQRKANPLTLSIPVVETIRRLLKPLYEDLQEWRFYFGHGMRDLLFPAADSSNSAALSDDVLNRLADMIVRLGSQTPDGRYRWRFCCILLPRDSTLPLQQHSLVVTGQSKNAPHKVGVTIISPGKYVNSLSLRALQSGRIIYRPEISEADSTIALRELEGPMRSAVAVPVGGEKGQPVAILYIVSDQADAFSKGDQRVLRVMGRIVEELVRTYTARQDVTEELGNLITNPSIVDILFKDFLSENEFIQDTETLLAGIKTRMDEKEAQVQRYTASDLHHDIQFRQEESLEEVVSFISMDVDNQSGLASKYGDGMIRNVSRTIGLQVQEMIRALITKHTDCKLYHIYAARYYVLLKGIPLEQARTKAETIRQALQGPISIEQPNPPVRPLVLSDVTIRLGVSSYTYTKLEENLVSDRPGNIVAEVRTKITRALDVALNMGKDEGGNVVIAWNPEIGGFARWSPPRE